MQRLTKETSNLVVRLQNANQTKSWFSTSRPEEEICGLLGQIGDTGEAPALPSVSRFLSNSNAKIQQAARRTVHSLLSQLSPYDLMYVGESFDWAYGWYSRDSWDKLKPTEVTGVAGQQGEEGHTAVLGLMTFHRNGYVRHEAVRQLSKLHDGSELNFLLIRQNDWVEQIAADAQAAVTDRLANADALLLEESLEIILHLASLKRYDHGETITKTIDVLLREESSDVLRRVVHSPSRNVRRQIVRHGLEKSGDHHTRLVPLGIESEDAVIRLACCRHLTRAYDEESLTDVLDRLTKDRYMPVRREALRRRAEQFPNAATEIWKQALLDRHRSIRDLACWHIAKRRTESPTTLYRNAIHKSPTSLPALEGLAETCDESDIAFFRHLLTHPIPSRRCVAVRGLVRIGKASSVNEVLPMLRDESPRVVRAVWKTIGPHQQHVPRDELFTVAMDGKTLVARHTAVTILADMGKWESLPWLLKIASEAKADTAEYAEQIIRKVCACNTVFTKPSKSATEKITRELERSKHFVAEEVQDLVKAELSRFG